MSIHRNVTAWVFFALMAGMNAHAQSQVAIVAATLPTATVGVAYTFTFSATGGVPPYQWGLSGTLPGPFTLQATTGVFSGTPQTTGTFTFTVIVGDSAGGTANKIFSLIVNPAPLGITTQNPLFNGTIGQFYSQVFTASGGTPPYKWAITQGPVPNGLSFDTAAGSPDRHTVNRG